MPLVDPQSGRHPVRRPRDLLVREPLAGVELTPPELYLDRYPHELSGRQRQRYAPGVIRPLSYA